MRLATWLSIQVLRALPRTHLSRMVGRVCDARLPSLVSRAAEHAYVRLYAVDMADVVPRREPYPSVDAFFTRPLRPDARRISQARVVAPADGRLIALGCIDSDATFRVKAQDYAAYELIGESADSYVGGSYAIIYLAPRDYHRVHAPVDGAIRCVRAIPGDLYPVNTLGERHVPRLLVRNQRVVIFVETVELGRIAVVLVGAFCVGRITVPVLQGRTVQPGDHQLEPPTLVRRGEEIGTFHLGSTVVLLVGNKTVLAREVGPIQYGQRLE